MNVPGTYDNEAEFKIKFETQLKVFEAMNKGSQRKIWSKAKVNEVLGHIKRAKNIRLTKGRLTSMEYYWCSKYDVITDNGKEHLIFKKRKPEDPIIRIIPREDYFETLKPLHIGTNHGGRDKMLKTLKKSMYIPKKALEIFRSLCPYCFPNRDPVEPSTYKKARPSNATKKMNTTGVINIIDFQSNPDGEYKWLLKYTDQDTKFVNFRPLESNDAKKIAMELTKIFLTFGPPSILQSFDGNEFLIEDIFKELKKLVDWKIINGSNNKHPRSQAEITKNNINIAETLLAWMQKNNHTNWSVGCYFYQYYLNSSIAHKTVFGINAKDIFQCSNISPANSECNTTYKDGLQVTNSSTTSNNEENQSPQMENPELTSEIKIEFDTEMYDQYYNTENCTDSNISTEPKSESVDSCDNETNSEINFIPKPMEDSGYKITCTVCKNDEFIRNTVMCSSCNNNVHTSCVLAVDNEENGNEICYDCAEKQIREYDEEVALKGIKREAEEDTEDIPAKIPRPAAAAASSDVPAPSVPLAANVPYKHIVYIVSGVNKQN